MKPMIFVPATAPDLQALRLGESLPDGPAYAATPTLRENFGYAPEADEDADYAAQVFASLRCMLEGRDRCVLAVETDRLPDATGERDFGEVVRPGVRWADVRAIFVDDPRARGSLRAYAASVRGRTIAEVWEDRAAVDLTQEHDLLWFDPTELDQVLAELGEPPMKGD